MNKSLWFLVGVAAAAWGAEPATNAPRKTFTVDDLETGGSHERTSRAVVVTPDAHGNPRPTYFMFKEKVDYKEDHDAAVRARLTPRVTNPPPAAVVTTALVERAAVPTNAPAPKIEAPATP
jgi:hypothetical protein